MKSNFDEEKPYVNNNLILMRENCVYMRKVENVRKLLLKNML